MDIEFEEYKFLKGYENDGYYIEVRAAPHAYNKRKTCTWCLYVSLYKTVDDKSWHYPLDKKAIEYGKDKFFEEVFDDVENITWTGDEEKPLRYGVDYAHSWQEEDRGSPYYILPWELEYQDVPSQIILDIGVVNKRLQYFVKNGNFYHEQ